MSDPDSLSEPQAEINAANSNSARTLQIVARFRVLLPNLISDLVGRCGGLLEQWIIYKVY